MPLEPFKINPNQLKPHEIQNCLEESQKPSTTGHEAVLSIKILELLQHIAWQDEQNETLLKERDISLGMYDQVLNRSNAANACLRSLKGYLETDIRRLDVVIGNLGKNES